MQYMKYVTQLNEADFHCFINYDLTDIYLKEINMDRFFAVFWCLLAKYKKQITLQLIIKLALMIECTAFLKRLFCPSTWRRSYGCLNLIKCDVLCHSAPDTLKKWARKNED